MVQLTVFKSHVANASVLIIRGYRPNRETNTPPNVHVSDKDVLRAWDWVSLIARFDSYCVIKVSNVNALNQNVTSRRVDSISVKWEGWNTET